MSQRHNPPVQGRGAGLDIEGNRTPPYLDQPSLNVKDASRAPAERAR